MRPVPAAVADLLDGLDPAVEVGLLRPEALAAVRAKAASLPPVFSWAVVETRLTGSNPAADLLLCLIRSPETDRALVEGLSAPSLRSAAPLLARWASAEGALAGVNVLWMEWDAPFTREMPLQLIAIDPRFWGPDGPRPAAADQVEMAAAGYEATFGAPHDPAILRALGAAVAALPPHGEALFTASLRPRDGVGAADRLFVSLPRAQVLPWLDAIGWPGDRERAAHWLRRIVAPWEPAFLQVELDPAPRPYLGIEPCQTVGNAAQARERARFLRGLAAEGLADSARVEALLAWADRRELVGGAVEVRSFHLKAVLEAGGGVLVKGYLGAHREGAVSVGAHREGA